MMSLTFGLFTQVSGSGPLGPLVFINLRYHIQSNFNGSNTFGTMKISSRPGLFEPLRAYYRARPGGIIGYLFDFIHHKGILCVLIRIASTRR